MYVETTVKKGKKKTTITHLLRETYRENGKVKHKTIANLSHCTPEQIEAIRLALKHTKNLTFLKDIQTIETRQGHRVGLILALDQIARKLGLHAALGRSREGRLALLQVFARVANQGSRLSATRFAASHGVCDILGLDSFTEDDLYKNLAWLTKNKEKIEKKLFRHRYGNNPPELYLYDVTSSYFEGDQNYFAMWGYNRDGKKGKKQMVIGLLTDSEGTPLSTEIFSGNSQDVKTVETQLQKLKKTFQAERITLVGDRGMLKGPQIQRAQEEGFHYITAISKAQIRTLINRGVLQLGLFDEDLREVEYEGARYILRRNPVRADEMSARRMEKLEYLKELVEKKNQYLKEHKRAKPESAYQELKKKIDKTKMALFVKIKINNRSIELEIDQESLQKAGELDGCYAIQTDLPLETASKETVHQRYKDLALVERDFRTMKTGHLEIRPVFVRKKESTIGHVLVTMLACLIERELRKLWKDLDLTVQEGLDELSSIRGVVLKVGNAVCQKLPKLEGTARKLIEAAEVRLPKVLPLTKINVATRKKLTAERN